MNHEPYEAVIGLEVHAQLLTATKVFCGCPSKFGAEPNTLVCPVCLGLPGALPVLNREAVAMAVRVGLAMNCRIAERSVFARKNYFYPDCPKNYQISMYDRPLCSDGWIEFESEGSTRRIGIERIHLEEDAGKLQHGVEGVSLVDFNRCGVPLVEIVSRPEIRTPEEASAYLMTLRRILRYLEVCDGNMEEGSLRCDVNISIRKRGEELLGTKAEIKNLNSFKAVEMGIRFEIERQIEVLSRGGRIEQVTNLWDAASKRLVPMRSKEYAHDYRYFPEPDLLELVLDRSWIESLRGTLRELPFEREQRLKEVYDLSAYDSAIICSEREYADFFEEVVKLGAEPKRAANWIMRDILEEMNLGNVQFERGSDTAGTPTLVSTCTREQPQSGSKTVLTAGSFARLMRLLAEGAVSSSAGRDVLKEMIRSGDSPEAVIERLGLAQQSDESAVEKMVDEVIQENPEEVARYRAGKTQLLGFFVGQVMKKSRGAANPKLASDLLVKKLSE